jgi:hypothetical protein
MIRKPYRMTELADRVERALLVPVAKRPANGGGTASLASTAGRGMM